MDRQTSAPSTKRLKRLVLTAVIAASVPGCAPSHGLALLTKADPATTPAALSEGESLVNDPHREPSHSPANTAIVQPATYTDAAQIASPVPFAQRPNDASESSFGRLLELDTPRGQEAGKGEGRQGEGRQREGRRGEGRQGVGETRRQGEGETQRQADEENKDIVDPTAPPLSPSPSPSPNSQLSSGQPVAFFVQQALAVHPSIRAARQLVAAELDRIPQVTALPDPQFNNTFWPLHDNAIQTAAGRVANQMSLQQGVPFPEKLRTKGAIVSREAQMAQAEVERIERQITESVRLAYYEVWYATRAIQIIDETRDLVDDLTKVAEARYRAGGTQQDVLRAQLETDRLDDQLVQLRNQKKVSQADLAALLQQPLSLMPEATEELGIADAPLQLDSLIAQAEQCNPSLRGLAAEIQRDRQQQRLAGLQQYPDFMVGLNWGIVSDSGDVLSMVANGNDNLSFTIGTTLPVWREKINAGVREANRRTSSTVQRLEAERDEIYGRLRRLLAQADSLVEQTKIYEERLVPRTEDTLKLAIADYRGERTDFFTLIETYRELLMFETQLARINATLAGTIAQVDRTVGCPY